MLSNIILKYFILEFLKHLTIDTHSIYETDMSIMFFIVAENEGGNKYILDLEGKT